jgi:hypothetical protein
MPMIICLAIVSLIAPSPRSAVRQRLSKSRARTDAPASHKTDVKVELPMMRSRSLNPMCPASR